LIEIENILFAESKMHVGAPTQIAPWELLKLKEEFIARQKLLPVAGVFFQGFAKDRTTSFY
jgi:hypothetical protein